MKAPILILCFFISYATFAQKQIAGHYMPFGMVYNLETVKDDALSPVSYSGSLGGLSLGYYYQNKNWISLLEINGSAGFQKPDVNREGSRSETVSTVSRASYQLLRRVYSKSDWIFYAGLLSHNTFDYRQHNRYSNSSENYVALFTFGTSVAVQKPFTIFSKNFVGQYTMGFPFGTYFFRPSYIKPLLNEEIGSKGFAFWGDYYLLNSRMELIWIFDSGNQLRLFYNWEFASFNQLNKVQTDLQQIGISTVFKF